jgi:hypothetical protein
MTNIALMTSVRHGTTTLFAALEVATGQATGLCKNRHGIRSFWSSSSTWPAPTPDACCIR